MQENWPPLRRRLPEGHESFTKGELIEILEESGVPDDAPIWLYNYRQVRDTTKRPMDGMGTGDDGVHLW